MICADFNLKTNKKGMQKVKFDITVVLTTGIISFFIELP